MKKKLINNRNGITLVAVIITIIVMLILASVTVKIATIGGIIDKTQNASDQFTVEQEKEKVKEGYLAYKNKKMVDDNATLTVEDSSSVTGDSTKGWVVTFESESGNRKYKITKDGKVTQYAQQTEEWWIPTTAEKQQFNHDNSDYRVAGHNAESNSIIADGGYGVFLSDVENNIVIIILDYRNTNKWYVWSNNSETASAMGMPESNKWYLSEGGLTNCKEYTGTCPISVSDFSSTEICSQTYLNRVISNFNK